MRDIARIAREEGEDLAGEDGRRACLEVFLLTPAARLGEAGGESDLSYFSARLVLQGRPVLALLHQAGARYGLVLSDKLALQAVPLIGALCGAAVNHAFLAHYRDLARAHFTLRRLERAYGETRVQAAARHAASGVSLRPQYAAGRKFHAFVSEVGQAITGSYIGSGRCDEASQGRRP